MNLLTQTISKTKTHLVTRLLIGLLVFPLFAIAIEDHEHSPEEESGHKKQEAVVQMSDAMAEASGIGLLEATSGQLKHTTVAYGNIVTDPASLSHIRARFSGLITAVNATIGDNVKTGDVLVVVESNESLKRYKVTAPFNGIVIARHANAGELSTGQVLFSVANYDQVWAQLKIFSQQLSKIRIGQEVVLSDENNNTSSTISHIVPASDNDPYMLAMLPIKNKDRSWPPGFLVKGKIHISSRQADLLVTNTAIQTVEGEQVVFVKEGDKYESHQVELGESDGEYTEVIAGLSAGDLYVSKNSFLLKADLEKSEAAHAH